jgi:hypothetical protein
MLGGLNMPRNALWGMPGRLAQGDWLGAAPGLAGLAAGGLTAATGVGLPFAGLVGSAVGGLGEGIEEATRPDMQAAPTSSDLVKQLGGDPDSFGGQALGMGLGMAGDPLTYAGGLGGEAGGKAAGEAAGGYLEREALARGPGYPGGPQKFLDMIGDGARQAPAGGETAQVLQAMARDPNAERLASYMRPGSYPLGEGAEGKVFGHDDSAGVLRYAGGPNDIFDSSYGGGGKVGQYNLLNKAYGVPLTDTGAPQPRVIHSLMNPAASDVSVGDWGVSHAKKLDVLHEDAMGNAMPGQEDLEALLTKGRPALDANVASSGYKAVDSGERNLGRDFQSGKALYADPSSIVPDLGNLPSPTSGQPQGGKITNWLLNMLGSDKSVQAELEAKLAQGAGSAGMSSDQVAAFHGVADANLPVTKPGGGAFLGPNAGLPTGPPQGQASELMKALGLEPSSGLPTRRHALDGVPGWDTGMR